MLDWLFGPEKSKGSGGWEVRRERVRISSLTPDHGDWHVGWTGLDKTHVEALTKGTRKSRGPVQGRRARRAACADRWPPPCCRGEAARRAHRGRRGVAEAVERRRDAPTASRLLGSGRRLVRLLGSGSRVRRGRVCRRGGLGVG